MFSMDKGGEGPLRPLTDTGFCDDGAESQSAQSIFDRGEDGSSADAGFYGEDNELQDTDSTDEELIEQFKELCAKVPQKTANKCFKEFRRILDEQDETDVSSCRYFDEFEEINRLGRGGYGTVYKVRSKIDKQLYAVKKIKLKARILSKKRKFKKLQNEVEHLAALSHSHVIRYHTAWFGEEPLPCTQPETVCTSSSESDQQSSSSDKKNNSDIPGIQAFLSKSKESGSTHKYMYIQMQLCSHTLACWLEERNEGDAQDAFDLVDAVENLSIFKDILVGIKHIHSLNVIHRDLKPANIFLEVLGSGEKRALIGDFGLAKEDFSAEVEPQESQLNPTQIKEQDYTSHTANVGTPAYAAPEQYGSAKYDHKADIFSSGIILLELFHPFKTKMEQSVVFGNARNGTIPQEIKQRWPAVYQTINQLTHNDSSQRPHAAKVLEGPLFPSPT